MKDCEKKYKVLTPYFYKLFHAGQLEANWDFIDWAGLYDIKLHRKKARVVMPLA